MAPVLRRLGLAIAAAALGAGCLMASDQAGQFEPGDDDNRGDAACAQDSDCTLAGPSCCECPTFALHAGSGWGDACEQVDCPTPGSCPALEARCDLGHCVAACAPRSCELTCETGFVVDAAGCTVCQCDGGPLAAQCNVDGDCARVPADCCGCDRGGTDTAVPVAEAGAFVDALGCSGEEACPGVSTCDPRAMPRCNAGRCELGSSGVVPPPGAECGRPDLPPCPAGETCVINTADGEAGEGRCLPS
jgi:hypothetical protein